MTFRLPISVEKVVWRDGQKVNQSDMLIEQNYNTQTQAAILNNFFGSGLIPVAPDRTYIFDSDSLTSEQSVLVAASKFDGYGLQPHAQPGDTSLGVQLEVQLTDSEVFGRRTVNVLVIGLDFEGTLQYERFTFHRNEVQVGEKHFIRVLGLIFNNFKGNSNGSRSYGGRITIREALPMQLSKWVITSSQNVEPNLFFRDIKLYSLTLGPNITVALKQVISDAIGPSYSVDALNITTTGYKTRYLSADDVITRYAQKFLATANNIQKITLLLGVSNDSVTGLDWSGDLVISIYALQTSVACPSDIVPTNAIDFLPDATPLAQLSINQSQLKERGIVLNDVEQPVDFVFANTKVANATNSSIQAGQYYMVSIQRIGDAASGNIFTITGTDRTDDSKFAFFNGVAWTNVSTEDMWYEVWSDCFKTADGMGVDLGTGMMIPKTTTDSSTGATIDNSYNSISFTTSGQNQVNYAVAQAVQEKNTPVQDQRTGNSVYSKQITNASISTVTSSTLTTLKESGDPIILGCGYDTNCKGTVAITGELEYVYSGVDNKLYIVNPPAELLAVNLVGCKIYPNINSSSFVYRIADAVLCVDGYGDLNGDGYVDATDRDRLIDLINYPGSLSDALINKTPINGLPTSTLELLRADTVGGFDFTSALTEVIEYIEKARTSFTKGSTFNVLELTLEHNVGRNDGYYDYSDTYVRQNPYSSNLISIGSMTSDQLEYYGNPNPVKIEDDTAFIASPYVTITYSITNNNDYWSGDLVLVSYTGRMIPCTFTSMDGPPEPTDAPLGPGETKKMFTCENRYAPPSCPGGENTFFVPGNLMVGGNLLRNAQQFLPVDYELGIINIEMPETPHTSGTLDVFHLFIMDIGTGFTTAGYPAMRFADGTTVQSNALDLNQLRFEVAIQSYSPNLDGYSVVDGYGIIIDPIIGINMLNLTGVLDFRIANTYADPVYPTIRTKIQISVGMKKSGWQNQPLTVTYGQSQNLTIDVP